MGSDVIYTERRGQSQKPEEIYQLIEELVPGGESRLQSCRHKRHQNPLLKDCQRIKVMPRFSSCGRMTSLVLPGILTHQLALP